MTDPAVLVVDDQPHVIRVIRRGLERKGYRVDTARDGLQALERLREGRYDVMITDLEMPRLDGRSLCERAHSEMPGAVDLVLLITGRTDPELREWAAGHPGTEFFEKPLSLRSLNDRLERHFAARSESAPAK